MIRYFIKKKIPINNSKIYFIFSGRVAINILSKKFKKISVALIPEYICNVVDKSFNDNYKIIRYKLNNAFEPDMNILLELLASNKIDILLLASLYGSGDFMNDLYNKNSKLYQIIKDKNIEVIIDFAQDFYQIYTIHLNNYYHYHYIFSFNDKSFMGSMGGLIISNTNLTNDVETKKIPLKKIFTLAQRYFIKILHCKIPYLNRFRDKKIKNIPSDSFEFSYCNTFPYAYDNYRVSIFQLFLALLGIFRLKTYKKNKIKFIKNNTLFINKTKLMNTSTYLSFNVEIKNNKMKKPYAYFDNKYQSVYPDLNIIHNKGFCDK